MSLSLWALIAATTHGQVTDVTTCTNDLKDLAEYVRFAARDCSAHPHLFDIDGKRLDTILDALSNRLQDNLRNCPCVGPCEPCDAHNRSTASD